MHVAKLIASDPNWLATLEEQYKISVTRDGDLVSLKYNQIESPMHEPVVQECRGMVVHVPSGKILAHPYNKFWNHGDKLAAEIDWATARCLEKLDGSLMLLFWEPHVGWTVASSGTPRGTGTFGSDSQTFGDAFWKTWETLGMRLPPEDQAGMTYCFEFCDQPNRVVVRHEKPRIVLHGARWECGQELSHDELHGAALYFNWELVKSYPLTSIADCLKAAEELDPTQCEGFVVVDSNFNRVKIKSPRYVILHHMKGEATVRRAIELWQTGETEELLGHFPEMAATILPVHEKLDVTARVASSLATLHAGLDRKSFAEQVKHTSVASVAFKLFGKDTSVEAAKAVMRAQGVQTLERMIG